MIIQCPRCGNLVSDKAAVCPSCGASLANSDETTIPRKPTDETIVPPKRPEVNEPEPRPEPKPEPRPKPKPEPELKPIPGQGWAQEPEKKKTNLTPILLSVALALVILGVGGFFLYNNVIKPRQIDKNAPRYYTFAPSVVLRSSKSSGADFNKIGSLPYGTELITYDHGSEWSEVKVNSVNAEGKKIKGFIASPFILEKSDFFLLNSIFGDTDSKSVIETSKCRRALLNYFKGQNLIGRLSAEETAELGLPMPTQDNQWQVYCLPKDATTNNVYFKRLLRKDSKFTDFAVIIKNISTGERKLLFFFFDDDETPHLAAEQAAPEYGTIQKVSIKTVDGENYLVVDYTE